jgi:hypothetical protein
MPDAINLAPQALEAIASYAAAALNAPELSDVDKVAAVFAGYNNMLTGAPVGTKMENTTTGEIAIRAQVNNGNGTTYITWCVTGPNGPYNRDTDLGAGWTEIIPAEPGA